MAAPGTGGRSPANSFIPGCGFMPFYVHQAKEQTVEELLGDPFEGHYTIEKVLDIVVLAYYNTNGKAPKLIRFNPVWLRDMLKELARTDRPALYEPYKIISKKDRITFCTACGPVDLCSDKSVSVPTIFELD